MTYVLLTTPTRVRLITHASDLSASRQVEEFNAFAAAAGLNGYSARIAETEPYSEPLLDMIPEGAAFGDALSLEGYVRTDGRWHHPDAPDAPLDFADLIGKHPKFRAAGQPSNVD